MKPRPTSRHGRMAWAMLAAPGILLLASLAAQGPSAQEATIAMPSGAVRGVAMPRYWLNAGPDDRLPIRERLPERQLGFSGVVPPFDRRDGLMPWAASGLVARDRPAGSSAFSAISFGLSYRTATPGWQLQANYGAEVTGERGRLVGTQGGFASLATALDRRTRLVVTGLTADTRDLRGAQGALLGAATRLKLAGAGVGLAYKVDPHTTADLDLLWGWQQSEAPAFNATVRNLRLETALAYRLTPRDRIEGRLWLERFDFAPGNDQLYAARLGYTRDLGVRLAASGHVDLMHTTADGGHDFASIGGSLVQGWANARLSLGLDRDMLAVPGINTPVKADSATARMELRLDRGLLLDVSAEHRRLDPVGAASATRVNDLHVQLSYAVDRQLWLWGRIGINRQNGAGGTTDDRTLAIGLSRNLRF